jgi:hypothetical protein
VDSNSQKWQLTVKSWGEGHKGDDCDITAEVTSGSLSVDGQPATLSRSANGKGVVLNLTRNRFFVFDPSDQGDVSIKQALAQACRLTL